MCGVVGVLGQQDVNQTIFDALNLLQHRGQEASGIVTCHEGHLALRKGSGLVRDVFRTRHMLRLKGTMGLGHVRYPTAGSQSEAEAQPFYVNSPYGITLAHNGNLTNAEALKSQLFREDLRHLNTESDSEVILNVLAHELHELEELKAQPDYFFKAVENLYQRVRGAFGVVAMITNVGLLGFRDPHGIRPLIYGKRETLKGPEYMIASESVALTAQGFEIIRDIRPGEAVFIDVRGTVHLKQCVRNTQLSPCMFEFVYFARPDSTIDGISVYKVRKNTGKCLAQTILKQWPDHDIDVVIPVPETSRSAAVSLATQLNLKFREGFVKNRYIGRTFIMPGQKAREKSVRQKLNTVELEFKDRNVLIVDDSIVRGTTSREIIQMAREAGANKVYFASASPPIRFPNIYGIDMPTSKELVAFERTVEEVRKWIGADRLIYTELEDLISITREGNPLIERFESSVFDGEYLTGDEHAYLSQVALTRAEGMHGTNDRESIQAIDFE